MCAFFQTLRCKFLALAILGVPTLTHGDEPPKPDAAPPYIAPSNNVKRTEEQIKLLTDWLTRPRLTLTGIDWEADLQSAKESKWEVPKTGTRVPADQLRDARSLLLESAAQLIATQFSDTATPLLAYMKEHGEISDPDYAVNMRAALDPGNLLTLEALYDRFWNVPPLPVDTHWVAGVSGSGTVLLWTTVAELPREAVNSLGAEWGKAFGNISSTRHGFVSTVSRKDVLARDGRILWGDVSFVVIGDAQLEGQPMIVSLRFWWDPATSLWHPAQLSHSSTGPSSMITRIVY